MDVKLGNSDDFILKYYLKFLDDPKMGPLIAAGVDIDWTMERTPDGDYQMTATTRYPVGIAEYGGVTYVYQAVTQ